MNSPVHPDDCKSIFEKASDAMLIIEASGAIRHANPAARRLLNYSEETLRGLHIERLAAPEAPVATPFFSNLLKSSSARCVTRFITSDGLVFDGEWTSSQFIGISGEPLILMILRDVSDFMENQRQLKEAETRATQLAVHDFLTGLLNRRGFEEFMDRELDRAKRSGRPTGMIMMDIDHFKQINDRHGHTGGDFLLREFAALMTRSLRDYDVLARFAGDEFILLLPETSQGETLRIAERLRAMIEAYPVRFNGTALRITASMGVISVPASFDGSGESLIALVDKALYLAKEKRNCVCFRSVSQIV